MTDERPHLRIHIIALAGLAAVVGLVVAVYFLRSIMSLIETYQHLYVIAFLACFALWCYWVVVALVRRRISQRDADVA